MPETDRPQAGSVEERTFDLSVSEKKIRGKIPYGVESRDLGGWTEIIEPTALRQAKLDELVATVDHAGVPIARYPATLDLEDRSDGLHWALTPPQSRADVREAVERGDLRGGSWRMVVARDEWRGDVRHVHEISELRDVSVVTTGAYPAEAAPVELRSKPDETNNNKEDEMSEKEIPERSEEQRSEEKQEEKVETVETGSAAAAAAGAGNGLKVEDRTERIEEVEDRDFGKLFVDSIREIKVGEVRALSSTGNALSPTDLSTTLFQGLRASSIALQSGIPVITTDKERITWPKLSADASPTFYSEGGTITAGDPTFVSVTSIPQKIAHIVQASNELIDDSDPPAIQVLSDHLTETMALKLDSAIYMGGTALPGITGFNSMSGVQTGGTLVASGVAGTASYGVLIDAVGRLQAANAPAPYVAAMNPASYASLRKVVDTTGQAVQPPPDLPTVYTSTQITGGTTNGVAFVYSPSQFAVVSRQDATVEVDRSRLFNSDQSEIRGKLRANFVAVNSTAAVKVTAT